MGRVAHDDDFPAAGEDTEAVVGVVRGHARRVRAARRRGRQGGHWERLDLLS